MNELEELKARYAEAASLMHESLQAVGEAGRKLMEAEKFFFNVSATSANPAVEEIGVHLDYANEGLQRVVQALATVHTATLTLAASPSATGG